MIISMEDTSAKFIVLSCVGVSPDGFPLISTLNAAPRSVMSIGEVTSKSGIRLSKSVITAPDATSSVCGVTTLRLGFSIRNGASPFTVTCSMASWSMVSGTSPIAKSLFFVLSKSRCSVLGL